MLSRYENRAQLALALLIGLLLLGNLFALAFVAFAPGAQNSRAALLLSVSVVTLMVSVPFILLFPRWLLRPFRQLFDEAARAPIAQPPVKARDETEFVLETFQAVVAELRAKANELERLNEQVRARARSAEELNARIIASIPSGLIAFNSQGYATVINDPAAKLLQLEGEAIGKRADELFLIAPELVEMVDACLQRGEIYRREEVTATGVDGRARRLGVTVAPIATQGGDESRGALCLMTDITEILELREAVARKKNLESLGEMAAGLAHEFKNALATLQGYAQLLQRTDPEGVRNVAITALLEEVRDLSAIVTAFLNFARPRPLTLEEIELRGLLDECREELGRFYEERLIELIFEGAFGRVRADAILMRQALLNILRNAAEAIPDGAAERKVFVRGRYELDQRGNGWNVIEIEDTGSGIPPQNLERIFIPFFTTKRQGHGIGLALAHRVIADHNGTLLAANSNRGGAVFTVRLPALAG